MKRPLRLWITLVAVGVGGLFLATAPLRRAAYLDRATVEQLQDEAERTPNDVPLFLRLGAKLRGAGRTEDALAVYTHAANLAPDNLAAWSNASELSGTLHGPKEAVGILGAFVRNHPNDAKAHLALARLDVVNGAHREAVTEAKRALDLDPGLGEARQVLEREAHPPTAAVPPR